MLNRRGDLGAQSSLSLGTKPGSRITSSKKGPHSPLRSRAQRFQQGSCNLCACGAPACPCKGCRGTSSYEAAKWKHEHWKEASKIVSTPVPSPPLATWSSAQEELSFQKAAAGAT